MNETFSRGLNVDTADTATFLTRNSIICIKSCFWSKSHDLNLKIKYTKPNLFQVSSNCEPD